jgi:hypothetical protein
MPDVWTFAPEKLRQALIEQGATCGVEARVLKPRDPEWTCHVYSSPYSYDIYIHPMSSYLLSWNGGLQIMIIVGGLSIIVGLLWGRRFWRRPTGPAG